MATAKKAVAAKPQAKPKPQGKTQRWMASYLDISQQRVSQFVVDTTFPVLPDGTLDPDTCRVKYIRWLRDEARRSTAAAQTSRAQEMRAKEIELRIAREEGRLVPLDGVQAAVADILGTYRYELTGLPAAVTRDLPMRAEIEKYLNDAMDRCRERFAKAGDDLRSGREIGMEGEEPESS